MQDHRESLKHKVKKIRKAVVASHCVSCGACMKVCPFGALSIPDGVMAVVDKNKCVGCGKCTQVCPANAIKIEIKEVHHEVHA